MMIQDAISSGVLDNVLQEFMTQFKGEFSQIQSLGKTLFVYLAVIQVTMSALWIAIKGDLKEGCVKGLQIAFTLSVFYTLICYGGTWMPQIIDGFINVGS